MKKALLVLVIALMLAAVLSACGGGSTSEPQAEVPAAVAEVADAVVEAEPPSEAATAVEEAAPAPTEATDDAAAPAETSATEATAPADDAVDASSDLQMSGIDAESGLEINPEVTQPDTDYIIRGKLSSFNLIPQDNPEFLIEGPNGIRYRIQTQPVPEIFLSDGSQLPLHEYVRGLPMQATARLTESSRATSVMESTDMVILSATP